MPLLRSCATARTFRFINFIDSTLCPYNYYLLFYCDLISCTTPACFSTFYRCAIVPTLVENYTCLLTFFVNKIIMTGEPILKKEMAPHAPATNNHLKSEVSIRFIVSYVQPVTHHYESRTIQKTPLQSKQPL